MSLRPLITICGTTGVGKSKLAIELAIQLLRGSPNHGWKGARIINADSMQVYSGMDVVTNKVPEAEMQGIEHLLIGFKKPGEQYFVGQWVQDAIQAVSIYKPVFHLLVLSRYMFADRRNTFKGPNTYCCWWDVILDSTPYVSRSVGLF